MFKNIAATLAMVLFALVASTNAATVSISGAYMSIKGGAFNIHGYTSSGLGVFQVLKLANENDIVPTLPGTGFDNNGGDLSDIVNDDVVADVVADLEDDDDGDDSEESSAGAYPTASQHMLDHDGNWEPY